MTESAEYQFLEHLKPAVKEALRKKSSSSECDSSDHESDTVAGSVEPINVSGSESDEDEEEGDGSADFEEVMTEEQAELMTAHMYSEFEDW